MNKVKYDTTEVRRQDRLLDEERAVEIIRNGEYGVLSMVGEDGTEAYGIPVNYVWDGNGAIYLHCAPEGRKLRCIEKHAHVSFCIVGTTNVVPNKFTTAYESVVLECAARRGLPEAERMEALRLLLLKYSPNDIGTGLKYAEKSFHRTEIIKLSVIRVSGKCKKMIVQANHPV